MLKTIKPKTARSARALKKREPKIQENQKTAIFLRGHKTNNIINTALSDLCALKKPDAITFSKKNEILPFEDDTSLEFFSQKNDASLFVIGNHTKKRPQNLIFVRMFDGQVLDMIEVGVVNAKSIADFKTPKCAVGMKPCFIFNGDLFETSEIHKKFKNMLLDLFRGQTVKSINLSGIEHVISVTAGSQKDGGDPSTGIVYFRAYSIQMKKSGQRIPRVELEEMGPSFDFRFRRTKFAKEDVYRAATRVPKELKPKKIKNIDVNEIGDRVGRIHLGKQDLSQLQTRKMKGLKKRTINEIDAMDIDEIDKEDEGEEIFPNKKQKV
ncbi:320_t:CDS:2 [Ambispora gerdemannii]|uniref:Ribosome production factor 2 homolog n=1 Tax=Ambispora gerdemannii TaxID=144530 RepID=A0A9N8ZJ68_9GLOM|nr:320_t:CDS:2 [Ambispora gerdemannii]